MDLVSWTFGGDIADTDKPVRITSSVYTSAPSSLTDQILVDTVSPFNSLSFKQLATQVRQLIAGLRAQGVQPGDCVCVNCFNDLQYSVLYFGIIGAGAIFTGLNPAFTPNELRHHFDLTKPSLFIVEPPMLEKTLTAAKMAGIPTDRMYAFDTATPNFDPSICSWTALLSYGECDWVKPEDPDTTTASYNPTSGTSGLPKVAMITHSYHVTQAASQCEETGYQRSRLLTLPPFHAFGSPILPSSIRQGIPTYIMRRYAETPFLDSITRYGITETYVPPPVLMALPKSPLATRDGLSSLRSIWMGGASVKFAQQKPLYDLLHEDACIRSVWGMTEAGWITCVQDRTRRGDDSVGQPLDGFDIRIIDTDGNPITADDASGEILVRVPHPFMSYVSNFVATTEAFTPCNTYMRTGDIGYRLTDPATGKPSMFIIDRAKELIKVRGWQVSPTEIESELMQHPAIADAAVIGIKEADGVEEFIHAYIVRKVVLSYNSSDDTQIDEHSLRPWLRERLAGYKVPAEFNFVLAIPRNGTGKILRRVLREGPTKPHRTIQRRVDSGVCDEAQFVVAPLASGPALDTPAVAPLQGEPASDTPVIESTLSFGKSDVKTDNTVLGEATKTSELTALPTAPHLPIMEKKKRFFIGRSKSPAFMWRRLKKFVSEKNKHIVRVVPG